MGNNYPDRATIDRLKWLYPAGSRVQLDEMDDPQAPPPGTFGTVYGVDDAGSIMVQWDNGCGLSVVYGADRCHLVRRLPVTKGKGV